MSAGATLRRVAQVLLTIVALGTISTAPGARVALAAAANSWAEFGKPTVKSSFVDGIDFSQPVTITRPLGRAELLLTVGDAIGPAVIPGAIPIGTGPTTLSYHFDPAADGHLYPGSLVVARWRLVSGDDPTDVSVGPDIAFTISDDRFNWQTATGDLIRVHWYVGPASFGQRALRVGEDAVRQAADLLQVTESDPIDFFVYADQDAFLDALGPGTRENLVGGSYIPGTRLMFALIPPEAIDDPWVGTVVPHELTHLVFETAATNPYHFPPRWLNEGLAVYLSQGYDSSDRGLVEGAAKAGSLIALDGLIGQFPTSSDRFSLAYAESVSAVDYLIRTHGRDPLVSLIRSYADGRTDDEAFSAALGVDMSAFGEAWLADLGAAAPTRYGPQPAPPGPVPPAWSGEAAASPGAGGAGGATGPGGSGEPNNGVASDATGLALIVALVVIVIGFVAVAGVIVRRRRAGSGSS